MIFVVIHGLLEGFDDVGQGTVGIATPNRLRPHPWPFHRFLGVKIIEQIDRQFGKPFRSWIFARIDSIDQIAIYHKKMVHPVRAFIKAYQAHPTALEINLNPLPWERARVRYFVGLIVVSTHSSDEIYFASSGTHLPDEPKIYSHKAIHINSHRRQPAVLSAPTPTGLNDATCGLYFFNNTKGLFTFNPRLDGKIPASQFLRWT